MAAAATSNNPLNNCTLGGSGILTVCALNYAQSLVQKMQQLLSLNRQISVDSAESSSSSLWPPNARQTTLSTLGSSLSTVSSTLSSVVSQPATTFHPTSNNKTKSHFAEPKTAIGVFVPISVIAIILLGLWAWWKSHRRFQSAVVEKRPATRPDGMQPHFEQKAELEDEVSRRHEIEALERMYDKDGNEFLELPERHSRHGTPERNSGCSMSI